MNLVEHRAHGTTVEHGILRTHCQAKPAGHVSRPACDKYVLDSNHIIQLQLKVMCALAQPGKVFSAYCVIAFTLQAYLIRKPSKRSELFAWSPIKFAPLRISGQLVWLQKVCDSVFISMCAI